MSLYIEVSILKTVRQVLAEMKILTSWTRTFLQSSVISLPRTHMCMHACTRTYKRFRVPCVLAGPKLSV